MNSRREFREIVKISRESSAQKSLLPKLFGALRLFILFFLMSLSVSAQEQQYDINDPRNPNCPCHKLQKLADDEYQRQQNTGNQFISNFNKQGNINNRGNNLINFNPIQNNVVNDNIGNDNESNKIKFSFETRGNKNLGGSGLSSGSAKKKKSSNWMLKKIHRAKIKHSKIKKVKPNYAVCYKW